MVIGHLFTEIHKSFFIIGYQILKFYFFFLQNNFSNLISEKIYFIANHFSCFYYYYKNK